LTPLTIKWQKQFVYIYQTIWWHSR